MNIKKLIGKEVIENKTGTKWKIAQLDYVYMKVKLEKRVKTFYYPKSFEDDLTICDDSLNAMIQKDLADFNNKVFSFKHNQALFFGCFEKEKKELPLTDLTLKEVLEKGDCFEGSIEEIYLNLCDKFKWKRNKKDEIKNCLYAQNCTLEGYSVQFINESSYNEKINDKFVTMIQIEDDNPNLFFDNDIGITSISKDPVIGFDGEKRLVFLLNKAGQYVFWGIYDVICFCDGIIERQIKSGYKVRPKYLVEIIDNEISDNIRNILERVFDDEGYLVICEDGIVNDKLTSIMNVFIDDCFGEIDSFLSSSYLGDKKSFVYCATKLLKNIFNYCYDIEKDGSLPFIASNYEMNFKVWIPNDHLDKNWEPLYLDKIYTADELLTNFEMFDDIMPGFVCELYETGKLDNFLKLLVIYPFNLCYEPYYKQEGKTILEKEIYHRH